MPLAPAAAMTLTVFVITFTIGAATLALWIDFRARRAAPETLGGVLVHLTLAFVAGWLLVPPGMSVALRHGGDAGPVAAVMLFALPALVYLLLATLWAMRALQKLLLNARG